MTHEENGASWARQKETAGLTGLRIILTLHKVLGHRVIALLLWPVSFFYYIFASRGRKASAAFRAAAAECCRERGLDAGFTGFSGGVRHFHNFSATMLDKIAVWQGTAVSAREVVYAGDSYEILTRRGARGKMLISSHLGDMEIARAWADHMEGFKVSVLTFTDNAGRFNQAVHEFAPQYEDMLIAISDLTPAVSCELDDRLERGEYLAIMADRLSPFEGRGGQRYLEADFMGRKARFPEGPFVLARMFGCDTVIMHAVREGGRIVIYAKELCSAEHPVKGRRAEALQRMAEIYARELETLTLTHPLQWFNFYDFWETAGADTAAPMQPQEAPDAPH